MKNDKKNMIEKLFCPKVLRDLGAAMGVVGVGFGFFYSIVLLGEIVRYNKGGDGHPVWVFAIVIACLLTCVKGKNLYDENYPKCK